MRADGIFLKINSNSNFDMVLLIRNCLVRYWLNQYAHLFYRDGRRSGTLLNPFPTFDCDRFCVEQFLFKLVVIRSAEPLLVLFISLKNEWKII